MNQLELKNELQTLLVDWLGEYTYPFLDTATGLVKVGPSIGVGPPKPPTRVTGQGVECTIQKAKQPRSKPYFGGNTLEWPVYTVMLDNFLPTDLDRNSSDTPRCLSLYLEDGPVDLITQHWSGYSVLVTKVEGDDEYLERAVLEVYAEACHKAALSYRN